MKSHHAFGLGIGILLTASPAALAVTDGQVPPALEVPPSWLTPSQPAEPAQPAQAAEPEQMQSSAQAGDEQAQVAAPEDSKAPGVELAAAETAIGENATDLTNFNDEEQGGSFDVNYFTIFYGPSLSNPSSYQPARDGTNDLDHPVLLKNFFNVGYNFTDHVAMTGTAFWTWKPVGGQEVEMRDPQLRLSHNELASAGSYNLYGDVRVHFGVSSLARANDELFSLQLFQIQTVQLGTSRLTAALYTSERPYFYGRQGFGPDFELYVAPAMIFQITPRLAAQVLYENNWSHTYGQKGYGLNFDGADLEPGVSWDITRWLNVSPYVHMYPSSLSWASTSMGATASVRFF